MTGSMLQKTIGGVFGKIGKGVKTAAYAFHDEIIDGRGVAQANAERAAAAGTLKFPKYHKPGFVPLSNDVHTTKTVLGAEAEGLLAPGQTSSFTRAVESKPAGWAEPTAKENAALKRENRTPKTFNNFKSAFNKKAMANMGKYAKYGALTGAGVAAGSYIGQAMDPDAVQSGGILKSGVRGAILGASFGGIHPLGKMMTRTKVANGTVQNMVNSLGGAVKTVGNHWLTKGAIATSVVAGSASVHLTSPVNRINNR